MCVRSSKMKIKILCRKEAKGDILAAIENKQIEFSDEVDFVLYEINHEYNHLLVKDKGDYIRIVISDIIYIESISQEIVIHTTKGKYSSKET